MANGEKYSHNKLTAAHNSLPFGTRVLLYNGEDSVIVVITDRGKLNGRTFDLSKSAFKQLGSLSKGIIKVNYKILENDSSIRKN